MPPDFSKYGVKQEEKEGINWSEYGIDTAPKASVNFEKYITQPWDGQSPAEQALGSSLLDVAKQNRPDLFTQTNAPKQPSPREENKARREAQDPKNPVLDFIKDNTVDALASGIDFLRYGTKPGQFVDRLGQSAVKTMGATPTDQSSTGNKVADTIADVAGAAAGYFTNPSAVGMGQSFNAFYNNPALKRVAQQAGNLVKNPLGQRALQEGAQEGLSAAAYSIPRSFIQGETSPGEVARNVAIEGALGAVGGAALPVIGKGLQQAGKGIKTAYNAAVESAPVSGINAFAKNVGQKTKTPSKPESISDVIDVGGRADKKDNVSWWERFYMNVVNEQAPIQRVSKQIGGKDLPTNKDPGKLAWLSRGWKGKADAKLEFGIFNETGEKVAGSLKEAVSGIKNKLDEWRELAVALRSKEYADAGLESGISPELADSTIAKYANDPELLQADQKIKEYIYNQKQSTLVDSGIWSKEKLDEYSQTQPNYIPMFRTQEKGLNSGREGASGKGFANVKDPTKRRTGSKKPIVDPLESIVKQTYKEQALAERNNVMRSLARLGEENPGNGLIEPVENPRLAKEIQAKMDEFILNPTADVEDDLRKAIEIFNPQSTDGPKNIFTYMDNGKVKQIQINDDALAYAVSNLHGESIGTVAKILGYPTGILKAGLVLTPDFITKNLVRDQFSAFINSRYGFIPIWDTLSGLASAIKKDGYFQKWLASGGANGAWVSLERDYLQGQLRKIMNTGIKKIPKNPIEILRILSEYSEQATRLGEFKRGVKKGANLKDAALASRDVTLDFSRSGAKTKGYNKAVAFANVAIQSVDKLARQFDPRKPKQAAKSIGKAATFITLPSLYLYMLNHNNPRYQELPQWKKDTYWNIPIGDDFISIPKPFELGTIFATFPEYMLQSMKQEEPVEFDKLAKETVDNFTPSIIPTLFMPWIEAFANKKTFTGAPIVPKREENLLPEDQYGPYTSLVGRGVGNALNVSPRIVDNYITGYTGSLGRSILGTIDKGIEGAGIVDLPSRPSQGGVNIPGLRPFASRSLEGGSQSVDDFYKEKERLTNERNSARKNQKPFKDEGKYRKYNDIGEAISKENARIRMILEDAVMTPEEKRDRINDINLRIINLARQAKGQKPIER